MPVSIKQQKMRKYKFRALDENIAPHLRLRAMQRALEVAGYTRAFCAVGRRLCNKFIADQFMPDELRDAAVRLLRDIACGEAERKNSLLAKIKIGDTIYQDNVAFRVTEITNGRVTAAEPINVNASV